MGPSELYDGNSIPEVAFQERFVERFEKGGFGKPRYVVAFSTPAGGFGKPPYLVPLSWGDRNRR